LLAAAGTAKLPEEVMPKAPAYAGAFYSKYRVEEKEKE
jgi:hypothetical protein